MTRASDASSGFITSEPQAIRYAVTDIGRGTHPQLTTQGLREGMRLNTHLFSGHRLIAYPSESASYSQRSGTAWRHPTHEHNTGGGRYGN